MIDVPIKGLKKQSSERILDQFPILEPKEMITRQIHFSDSGTKEITDTQNHLIYHGKKRDKSLYITPEFAYLELYDIFFNIFSQLKNFVEEFKKRNEIFIFSNFKEGDKRIFFTPYFRKK